jgi:hypothetical protein
MNTVYMAAAAIAIVGALLIPVRFLARKTGFRGTFRGAPDSSGFVVIQIFAAVVFVFGGMTAYWYRAVIAANSDSIVYAAWLALVMVGGMLVQVLSAAYRQNKTFKVTASDLLFPLLFSIVVFYPIWAIATTAARSFFVIHAAFLNGYFWESLVAAAKPVEGGR